jgi:glucose-1-phosphate thymidylyltransferase
VYIADGVKIENAVVGPHVSIGKNTKITSSIVKRSIIQENAVVQDACLDNSMLGNFAQFIGRPADLSVGDYNVIK